MPAGRQDQVPRKAECAHLRRQRGQDLVEFALLLPLLLVLTFGIIDFSRVVFTFSTLANAAREGARYGSIHPTDTAGITSQAMVLTAGHGCNAVPQVTVNGPGQGGNDNLTLSVKVDCDVQLITGIIPIILGGKDTFPLHAISSMKIE